MLGDPADDQDMGASPHTQEALFKPTDLCIYYMEQYRVVRDEYGETISGYQFCFNDDDGTLDSWGPTSSGSEAEKAGLVDPYTEAPSGH